MASRRNLKKKITYIASDLFFATLMEGVNREAVIHAIHNVLALIPRISHTEPGNVKGFYKRPGQRNKNSGRRNGKSIKSITRI